MLGEHRSRVRKLLGPYLEDVAHYRRVRPYAMAFEQIPRGMPENTVHQSEDQHHFAQLLDVARHEAIHLPVPKYRTGIHPEIDRRHWSVGWTFGKLVCPDPKALCAFILEARLGLALMLAEQHAPPAALLIGAGAQALQLIATVEPFAAELFGHGIRLFYGTVGELDRTKITYWAKQETLRQEPPPPPNWPDLFGRVLQELEADQAVPAPFRPEGSALPLRNFQIPPEKDLSFTAQRPERAAELHNRISLGWPPPGRRDDNGGWK